MEATVSHSCYVKLSLLNDFSCYFKQKLSISLGLQILLTSDVLFAFLRREYDLHHGIHPPVMGGEPASVVLR